MNMADNDDWREKLLKASGFSEQQMEDARNENEAAGAATDSAAARRVQKEKLSIAIEKKGRGGKTATIIYGFRCGDAELRDIASRLKNLMGCGGSCRDGEILLQGNRREEAAEKLRCLGFKV